MYVLANAQPSRALGDKERFDKAVATAVGADRFWIVAKTAVVVVGFGGGLGFVVVEGVPGAGPAEVHEVGLGVHCEVVDMTGLGDGLGYEIFLYRDIIALVNGIN